MDKYTFPDINCKAWFQGRGGGKSPFLVVEVDGKEIDKRLAGRIADDEASVREAAEGVMLAVEETKMIGKRICRKCGAKIVDNTIKEGRHKGQGRITCPVCGYGIII